MADKKAKATEKPEITLESTNARIDGMVQVLNNIITYCNTVEKWRTLAFKQNEKTEDINKDETEVISDADDKK